jgi:hypothetical protein
VNEECVLSCGENYNLIIGESDTPSKCSPNECEERIPFTNGSCSLKEDFDLTEGLVVRCYNLRDEDGIGICVNEGECPSGWEMVFFFFHFYFFLSLFIYLLFFYFICVSN